MATSLNRLVAGLFGFLLGISICIPSAVLLIVIYGLCLTDPSQPDYYAMKVSMMFRFPDPGVLTWPAAACLLVGLLIMLSGTIRPLLRKPPIRSGRDGG